MGDHRFAFSIVIRPTQDPWASKLLLLHLMNLVISPTTEIADEDEKNGVSRKWEIVWNCEDQLGKIISLLESQSNDRHTIFDFNLCLVLRLTLNEMKLQGPPLLKIFDVSLDDTIELFVNLITNIGYIPGKDLDESLQCFMIIMKNNKHRFIRPLAAAMKLSKNSTARE